MVNLRENKISHVGVRVRSVRVGRKGGFDGVIVENKHGYLVVEDEAGNRWHREWTELKILREEASNG